MALPQLYENFTLTSYDTIRFRDNQPEGCGSASPFSMGLNAIVTRSLGPLVKTFTLRGTWLEHELDEHSRMGRVPESSMMLNIAVRAAVDKMPNLESFVWQLNTKALETVYQGLSQIENLKSLTIRFPSSRHPRPTTMINPMTNLEFLKITDIDPLCYPDDISTLLAQSRKLKDLRLHWSPRMKQAQEASVRLSEYFRKCVSLNQPLKLKSISFQNFYAPYEEGLEKAIDRGTVEEMHVLSSPGIFADDYAPISFVETSWMLPCLPMNPLKCLRHDLLDKKLISFISAITALERLYYTPPIRTISDYINRAREPPMSLQSNHPEYPTDERLTSLFDDRPQSTNRAIPSAIINSSKALQDSYLKSIFNTHGLSLRHLLLPSRWALPKDIVVRLVRACPNLEQLGFAAEISSIDSIYIAQHYLPKLRALRVLIPTTSHNGISTPASDTCSPIDKSVRLSNQDDGKSAHITQRSNDSVLSQISDLNARAIAELTDLDDRLHVHAIGLRLGDMPTNSLKILGIGWKAFEIGEVYTIANSEILPKIPKLSKEKDGTCQNGKGPNSTCQKTSEDTNLSDTLPLSSGSEDHAQSINPNKRKIQTYLSGSPRPCPKARTGESSNHRDTSEPRSTYEIMNMAIPLSPLSEETDVTAEDLPLFDITDLSAYVTSTGHPISEPAKAEISRFLSRLQLLREHEGLIPKRKLKRVGWDVLKHWEIFALDTQEI